MANETSMQFKRALLSLTFCFILKPSVAAQLPNGAPLLALPVDCKIGQTCLVQKLYDLQAGPGRRDYRCGTLTTEDHDGIDIRVRTLADMTLGVAVRAASDGIVLRVRDGMDDISVNIVGQEAVKNRMAGNGLVIAHGNGWETQYSHLRKGSLRVKPGDKVKAGMPLGFIGMSGNAEFPHLHFSVRRNGEAVDPFLAGRSNASCVAAAVSPLQGMWNSAAASNLRYTPSGIIAAGFTNAAAHAETTRNQLVPPVMTRKSPALVFWIDSYGVQTGDVEHIQLRGPGGINLLTLQKPIANAALSWFSFFGKKRPADGWPAGTYVATYKLLRSGKVYAAIEREIEIK
jgi:hypothetical protein